MDIPSMRPRSPRTARLKAAQALKKVPTGLLLKKKAECDAKALKIVERMMEPGVDVDWLLRSLIWINKSHMEDTAEERSIVKLCGYVLCDNPLTKVVTKQYHISTIRNKVYDVSRVKNYCSYSCYSAAEYLMEQMLTSPLWLRDQEDAPNFKILPKRSKSARSKSPPGVEVHLTGIRLPEDTDFCEEKSEASDNDKETRESRENCVSRDEEKFVKSERTKTATDATMNNESSKFNVESTIPLKRDEESNNAGMRDDNNQPQFQKHSDLNVETMISPKEVENNFTKAPNENSLAVSRIIAKSPAESVTTVVSMPVRKSSEGRKKERGKPKELRNKAISFDTLTSRVEKSFKEWITDKTVRLLRSDVAEKQKILESVNREEKYAVLCKKLNKLQLEEEREANERNDEFKKPAPDFSVLQEEAKGLELKVRAFWEGKTVIDREMVKIENPEKQENETAETILPLLDLHAPNALRRRIFLDKLNRVLPDLLRALAGDHQASAAQYSYTSERCAIVKALVSTFALSATNITFKTAEWTMVALIIIKLLGMIDPRMKYLLDSEQATKNTSMILLSYNLRSNYLENLITSQTSPPSTKEVEEIEICKF